jgi:hypothetical protein
MFAQVPWLCSKRQIVSYLNVKAKFRCPLPGKVEMSAFAVVILFPKLLKRRSRDSGRIGVLVP